MLSRGGMTAGNIRPECREHCYSHTAMTCGMSLFEKHYTFNRKIERVSNGL